MNETLWTLTSASLGKRLREVSVGVTRGVTAVLGQSGAGKTSLLNLLVEFERPDAGTVECHIAKGERRRALFWAPQDEGLWPHLTVREHLAVMATADADGLLAEFDLASRENALPHTLSQGERARLAVARALAADAAALVMDEPLAHVDSARVGNYWAAIRRRLAETGASLIFATHSPGAVLADAERVIALKEGRVVYAGGVEELYRTPPTAELAVCLGEANWLEPADLRLWLGIEGTSARCLRPEQMAVTPAEDGAFVVESSRFQGSVAEVQLRHALNGECRRFWHRPVTNHLKRGVRVMLEVR